MGSVKICHAPSDVASAPLTCRESRKRTKIQITSIQCSTESPARRPAQTIPYLHTNSFLCLCESVAPPHRVVSPSSAALCADCSTRAGIIVLFFLYLQQVSMLLHFEYMAQRFINRSSAAILFFPSLLELSAISSGRRTRPSQWFP